MTWVRKIAGSVALVTVAFASEAVAADSGGEGRQRRQQAEGWLQLDQDQKIFRESAEPLEPREAASLDRLEQRQRVGARQLEQRQRRSAQTDRSLKRSTDELHALSRLNASEDQRRRDRQRLNDRIQRETLFPGLR